MKKILAFSLALALMFVLSTNAEPDIDFSSMTLEELYELQNEVYSEITFRKYGQRVSGFDRLCTSGCVYYVGKDIEAGTYNASFIKSDDASGVVYIFIYKDADDYSDNMYSPYDMTWGTVGNNTIISQLEEGEILMMVNGDVLFNMVKR